MYTTIPPQPKEKKPGQLERWQVEQYFDQGFLVVPSFFTNAELELAIEVSAFCLVFVEFQYVDIVPYMKLQA